MDFFGSLIFFGIGIVFGAILEYRVGAVYAIRWKAREVAEWIREKFDKVKP